MKKYFMPAILSLLLLFSFGTSVFAASIGDVLTEPEEGWKRVRFTSTDIQYSGEGWKQYKGIENESLYKNASFKFNFTGSKLRIISVMHPFGSPDISVIIDGKNLEKMSLVGTNDYIPRMMYEITGLSEGEHTAEFVNNVQGNWIILTAIDIDSNSTIKPHNPDNIDPTITLSSEAGDKKIFLNWSSIHDNELYKILRSTTFEGDYLEIGASNTNNFIDDNVTVGTTYYYVVTALDPNGQILKSNIVSATPNNADSGPSGDRAIMTITMTTGLQKEYDLSITEVNAFLSWYDAKDAGTGSSKYAIDKHNNNKGPFSKRIDYVIFKNILSFEVNEYSTATSAT